MDTFFAIVLDIIRKSIWPGNAFGLLGRISGAMSMAALLVFGFNYGFEPALLRIFEWWDWFLGQVASWIGLDALASFLLTWIDSFLALQVELHSHWRHVFFLLGVFIFRDSYAAYEARLPVSGTFYLVIGLAAAFVSSIGAGAIALMQGDLPSNFLIAVIPLTGLLAFQLIHDLWRATFLRAHFAKLSRTSTPTWLADFGGRARWALRQALIGLVLIAIFLPLAGELESPGLALLILLLGLLAIYQLLDGVAAARERREPGETFRAAYWRTGRANIGAGILGTFLWTIVFVTMNAGLDILR